MAKLALRGRMKQRHKFLEALENGGEQMLQVGWVCEFVFYSEVGNHIITTSNLKQFPQKPIETFF